MSWYLCGRLVKRAIVIFIVKPSSFEAKRCAPAKSLEEAPEIDPPVTRLRKITGLFVWFFEIEDARMCVDQTISFSSLNLCK